MQMGQRDFFGSLTEKQIRALEAKANGFPERIHKLYEKYQKEFAEHGICGYVVSWIARECILSP